MRTSSVLAAAASDGSFLGVDWGAFVVVFLVSFAAAVVIVASYALGLRLAAGSADDVGRDGALTSGARGSRPAGATIGAYACFAVGGAAVLYGLYLIIPQFH
jgi:hypothetical protein